MNASEQWRRGVIERAERQRRQLRRQWLLVLIVMTTAGVITIFASLVAGIGGGWAWICRGLIVTGACTMWVGFARTIGRTENTDARHEAD